MDIAKQRISARTENDTDSLEIDENTFDILALKYEPWSDDDKYPVIFHYDE